MNMLLIALAVLLVWRVVAGVKKGIVRELLSFISVLFVVLIIGFVTMIANAYHEKSYMTMAIMVLAIVVVSVAYSLIKIVFFPAKVISKLPVINGINKICGVVIGVAETLLLYWGVCYALMFIEAGTISQQLLIMIGDSKILTALYEYNLLGVMLESLKTKITF